MPRGAREKPTDNPAREDALLENSAATGGHPDEPLELSPNSRTARAATKRAAARATGTMSLSKKVDPETKLSGPAGGDGTKRTARAKRAEEALDKGSAQAAPDAPPTARVRRTKSNAEIAEGVTTTARRSPAPRSARTDAGTAAGTAGEPDRLNKRTGGARQRVPAPGNRTTTSKRDAVAGEPVGYDERPTSSTGGAKPPKRSARAGRPSGASQSKGADAKLAE